MTIVSIQAIQGRLESRWLFVVAARITVTYYIRKTLNVPTLAISNFAVQRRIIEQTGNHEDDGEPYGTRDRNDTKTRPIFFIVHTYKSKGKGEARL